MSMALHGFTVEPAALLQVQRSTDGKAVVQGLVSYAATMRQRAVAADEPGDIYRYQGAARVLQELVAQFAGAETAANELAEEQRRFSGRTTG